MPLDTILSDDSTTITVLANQLTQRDREITSSPRNLEDSPSVSPFSLLITFLIFICMVIGMFSIQVWGKVFELRRYFFALLLAVFAGSIPLVLPFIRDGVGFLPQASSSMVPLRVRVDESKANSTSIFWETKDDSTGAVRYEKNALHSENGLVVLSNNGKSTSTHRVVLENLEPNALYQFEILSNTHWYDNGGVPLEFFQK